jgi:hypothetical protein
MQARLAHPEREGREDEHRRPRSPSPLGYVALWALHTSDAPRNQWQFVNGTDSPSDANGPLRPHSVHGPMPPYMLDVGCRKDILLGEQPTWDTVSTSSGDGFQLHLLLSRGILNTTLAIVPGLTKQSAVQCVPHVRLATPKGVEHST